jgi:hypothetical protein
MASVHQFSEEISKYPVPVPTHEHFVRDSPSWVWSFMVDIWFDAPAHIKVPLSNSLYSKPPKSSTRSLPLDALLETSTREVTVGRLLAWSQDNRTRDSHNAGMRASLQCPSLLITIQVILQVLPVFFLTTTVVIFLATGFKNPALGSRAVIHLSCMENAATATTAYAAPPVVPHVVFQLHPCESERLWTD